MIHAPRFLPWLGSLALSAALPAQGVYQEAAPYDSLRFGPQGPETRHEGKWCRIVSIDGVPVEKVLAHCRREYRDLWKKRFAEDLVRALSEMGHPPGDSADLLLLDAGSGKEVSLPDRPMTRTNRQSVWKTWEEETSKVAGAGGEKADGAEGLLSAEAWQADLEELRRILDEEFAYRHLRKVDLPALLAEVKSRRGAASLSQGDFAAEVRRIVAAFGDAHAQVDEPRGKASAAWPPFLVEETDRGLIALRPARDAPVDRRHPFLVALDGVPIERWIEASLNLVNAGSEAYRQRHAIRGLRDVQALRQALALPALPKITLKLSRGKGAPVERALDLTSRRPIYGAWPNSKSRVLEGGLGYLRIPSMDDDSGFLDGIDRAMKGFKDTRGLVIDVRGNGGGSRAALKRLFPYFLAPADPPRVASVAAYRLHPGEAPDSPEGYLSDRFAWPAAWPGWSKAAREAIAGHAKTFRPEWSPPPGQFSAWHWLVLDRADNPRAYHYDRPVAVLLDTDCFSATDIFLGAFRGWRGVTLVGRPSGGGSGRARPHRLGESGIELRLASMASFQPDGSLYDGRGVQPDVLVKPKVEDFAGGEDTVLAAGLNVLRRAAAARSP